ncbi:unnamed protein product [Peniophora sp. CBMAI 1063]|nr:unnamed protein product [Peniophora sp. CBMAI 1063]
MSTVPARIRRLSEPYSPPPSPTMKALRIGSLHRSPGSEDSHVRPVHPAYAAHKPATAVGHTDDLDLEDELEDDYEPEPALTSDDATAPSSSRAPSPSLSPVDENAYIDVVTSSPQRESFLRSYARPTTPITKPDPRDEDVAAVLLSLSFPRVGPSPLVTAVPPPPPRPESPSPHSVLQSRTTPAISRIKVEKEASRRSTPHRISAVEEQLDRRALIDVPTEARVAEIPRTPSPFIEIVASQSPAAPEEADSPTSSPLQQLSPLPPSSPLPEEEEDEDAADIDVADESVLSRMSSPLSRLSSIPPSPTMDPEPLPADLDLPQFELPARDLSLSPEPMVMSPLSSPPTSRPSSPVQSEKSRASSPVQPNKREVEIVRPVHTKRKQSTPPPESPPRRKRARRVIPDSSPEPESDVEPVSMQVENAVESDFEEPEPAPAPAPRHARGKTSRGTRNATRASKPAKGSSRMKADAPMHIDDRSDKQCPHPALPSLIVEAFALSRATSLPATALYDAIRASYPAIAGSTASSTRSAAATNEQDSATLTQGNVEEVLLWGAARGIFELVPSSGDAIPPTFFYIPDADWSKERSGLHSALGGRVARAGKRAYKQYYWKPVVLPRGGGARSSRKRDQDDEVRKGWEVDWEE